jgi:hypothetical protein
MLRRSPSPTLAAVLREGLLLIPHQERKDLIQQYCETPTSPTSLIFQDDCFVAFTAWTAENCVCYGCSEPYASCHCGLQQTSAD